MSPAAERGTLPEPQVRAMFDRIARVYDLMNSVMTAGLHHQWRRRAADLANVGPGDRVLDVATGTGDLAIELAKRVAPGGEVIGTDFSEEMLAHARRKVGVSDDATSRASAAHADRKVGVSDDATSRASAARAKAPGIHFAWGNALDLPYADGEFAAATVGFGARNFSDLDQGLREMARVVEPGGRVVILEITTPQKPPLSTFFRLWFDRVVPLIGKVAGDPDAYDYLPNSVKRFPEPAGLAAALERAGLQQIRWVLTAGGIIALHVGTKPAAP
jgi:demethylmenaquinone methyltransferase/2-methoxy-6-polyprenyl-1,4-benzoquinol methylase